MHRILTRELRQAGLLCIREGSELNPAPPFSVNSLTGRAVVSSQTASLRKLVMFNASPSVSGLSFVSPYWLQTTAVGNSIKFQLTALSPPTLFKNTLLIKKKKYVYLYIYIYK